MVSEFLTFKIFRSRSTDYSTALQYSTALSSTVYSTVRPPALQNEMVTMSQSNEQNDEIFPEFSINSAP